MNWIFLLIAGIFEIGWPLGFKLSQTHHSKWMWIMVSVISMALSGYFLWLAQRSIPIGTAYAVWTGTGAVGTLLVGIFFFGDSASIWRMMAASLIVIGIVGIKLTN